jgi:hypothetical protein
MWQELPTLPDHLGSPPVFSMIFVDRSIVICVVFCRSLSVLFLLSVVLSVFLRIKASDYPVAIYNLFLDGISG